MGRALLKNKPHDVIRIWDGASTVIDANMNEFWALAVVLFIILITFATYVVRQLQYWKTYHGRKFKRALYSDVRHSLKSGDIILFVAHTHGLTNSLFTFDLFSHGGVVVEGADGELYLSDSNNSAGASIRPLLQVLDDYGGMRFLMSLSRPLDSDRKIQILQAAARKLPYPTVSDSVRALFGAKTHRYARHCMQHVAWMLDTIRLTPESCTPSMLKSTGFFGSSRAVTAIYNKKLPDGYRYLSPVELLLDDGQRYTCGAQNENSDVHNPTEHV